MIDTTKDNAQSTAARSAQQRRAQLAKGMNSTIATSPLGVTAEANTSKPTLLGYSK